MLRTCIYNKQTYSVQSMIGQRLDPYRGVGVGLPTKLCDGRGSIPTEVNCEASRVLRKLIGILFFLHVSVRICTDLHIYQCICMYLHVLFYMYVVCKYQHIYASIS